MKRWFTLVELLAVIAIIAILASLTLGLIKYGNTRAKEIKTTAALKKIEMVIEAYKLDRSAYPVATGKVWSDVFGQSDRYKHSQTGSPLLPGMVEQKAFEDGWKHEFLYKCPGDHGAYDLSSAGDDEQNGTADDINNWTRN